MMHVCIIIYLYEALFDASLNHGNPSPSLLVYSYNKKPSNGCHYLVTHTSLMIHYTLDKRQQQVDEKRNVLTKLFFKLQTWRCPD